MRRCDVLLQGDVMTFNMESQLWREWSPTPAVITDATPFPRGYMEMIPLPQGFGTGYVAPNAPDSGSFYFVGGTAPSSGVVGDATDGPNNEE